MIAGETGAAKLADLDGQPLGCSRAAGVQDHVKRPERIPSEPESTLFATTYPCSDRIIAEHRRRVAEIEALRARIRLRFEEEAEAPEWSRLYERRASYRIGVAPPPGRFLTAGADVQKDRRGTTGPERLDYRRYAATGGERRRPHIQLERQSRLRHLPLRPPHPTGEIPAHRQLHVPPCCKGLLGDQGPIETLAMVSFPAICFGGERQSQKKA